MRRVLLASAGALCGVLLLASAGFAQQIPSPAEPRRPQEPRVPAPAQPGIDVPRLAVPESGLPVGADTVRFVLTGLEIEGMTAYTPEEIAPLYQDLLGTEITLTRLFEVAQAIEQRYRSDGYFLSRAVIPAQRAEEGVFRIRVVEGYISDVVVNGDLGPVREKAHAILSQATEERPINIATVERYLLLTNDLPGVSVRAVLQPAAGGEGGAGASQLVATAEREAFNFYSRLDNRGSEFEGPWQLYGIGSANSFTKYGERTTATTYFALDDDEAQYYEVSSEWLLNDEGLSLRGYTSYSPTNPGASLEPFDIETESYRGGLEVEYPLIRTRRKNLWLGGGFDIANVRVDALDEPFTEDNLRVAWIGARGDLIDDVGGVIVYEAEVRQGVPIFDATDGDDALASRPDAADDFTTLSLDISRLQPLMAGFNLYMGAAGQYALQPVLADEEFTVGGYEFGRGYDPAELGGDHGVGATAELQFNPDFPIDFIDGYQLYTFYDFGKVWQADTNDEGQTLTSAGGGVRVLASEWFSVELELSRLISRDRASEPDEDTRLVFTGALNF